MDVSVKSRKTGKLYNITLGGNDQRLLIRSHTLFGLSGTLTVLTVMAFFAATTGGRPYSQEIFLALVIGTFIAVKRALTIYGEVKKRLEELVAKYESEHPWQ